jgi:DNA replicative helicase MCM subunit Mcm2 (Cdc46/Mcm family)
LFNDDTVIEAKLEQSGTTQDGKGSTVYDKEMSSGSKSTQMVVTRDFLKKYISYVKSQKDPELSDSTLSYTSECYAFLRNRAAGYD